MGASSDHDVFPYRFVGFFLKKISSGLDFIGFLWVIAIFVSNTLESIIFGNENNNDGQDFRGFLGDISNVLPNNIKRWNKWLQVQKFNYSRAKRNRIYICLWKWPFLKNNVLPSILFEIRDLGQKMYNIYLHRSLEIRWQYIK